MSNQITREEVINALLKYLPELSISLSNIVTILQKFNTDGETQPKSNKPLLLEVKELLPVLEAFIKVVPPKSKVDETLVDILRLYDSSTNRILIGLQEMIDWLQDENKPEIKLHNAIDLLFTGGQQIIEMVNLLTGKK